MIAVRPLINQGLLALLMAIRVFFWMVLFGGGLALFVSESPARCLVVQVIAFVGLSAAYMIEERR